jgi:hypothetical protein
MRQRRRGILKNQTASLWDPHTEQRLQDHAKQAHTRRKEALLSRTLRISSNAADLAHKKGTWQRKVYRTGKAVTTFEVPVSTTI